MSKRCDRRADSSKPANEQSIAEVTIHNDHTQWFYLILGDLTPLMFDSIYPLRMPNILASSITLWSNYHLPNIQHQ